MLNMTLSKYIHMVETMEKVGAEISVRLALGYRGAHGTQLFQWLAGFIGQWANDYLVRGI